MGAPAAKCGEAAGNALAGEATRSKKKSKKNLKKWKKVENKCFDFRSRVTAKTVQSDPKVLPTSCPK